MQIYYSICKFYKTYCAILCFGFWTWKVFSSRPKIFYLFINRVLIRSSCVLGCISFRSRRDIAMHRDISDSDSCAPPAKLTAPRRETIIPPRARNFGVRAGNGTFLTSSGSRFLLIYSYFVFEINVSVQFLHVRPFHPLIKSGKS